MAGLNYYDVLGVSRNANLAEIRRAYVRQLRNAHPDLTRSAPRPHSSLDELQRAYRCLREADTRREHDVRLTSHELAHAEHLRRVGRRLNRRYGKGAKPAKHRGRSQRSPARLRLALLCAAAIVIVRLIVG